MHRLAVRAIHDASFGEAERLLIEVRGGLDVRDAEHGCHSTVKFAVDRIDFLRHGCSSVFQSFYTNKTAVERATAIKSWLAQWIRLPASGNRLYAAV